MSTSTIQLLNTIEFTKRLNFNRRSNLGNFQEPALSSANIVIQTILGAPFRWRFNRQILTFTTTPGTQDYSQSVPTFGWIETSSFQDPDTLKWLELENKTSLGLDSAPGRSRFISAQIDDGNGNITFRMMPVPDKAYNVSITIQQKPPLFTQLSQTWAPIPDDYSNIYQWGFVTLMWLFADDPRWTAGNNKFVSGLLSRHEGLSETERNIFLSEWQAITLQPMESGQKSTQGIQTRQI